jgi:hypothetical protein
VNAIAPGAIRTPINKEAWGTEAALKELLRLIPYGRIGEPEDIAKAAVWLASDESARLIRTGVQGWLVWRETRGRIKLLNQDATTSRATPWVKRYRPSSRASTPACSSMPAPSA